MNEGDLRLPKLADARELIEHAGAEADTAQGSVRAAIANAMVGFKKEFYGKGPTAAKTYINDDYIFVVLEGGLTRNEETLLQAGEEHLVRQYRLRFEEAMAATTISAVEEIVGRKVRGYHSQIIFEPPVGFEIFLLESKGT